MPFLINKCQVRNKTKPTKQNKQTINNQTRYLSKLHFPSKCQATPLNPPPHKKSQVLFNIQETAKLKETNNINNKKSPRGIRPRHCSPSSQGAKYIMVTQETSPSRIVEVCDKYLFGLGKTGGLGQVAMKKMIKKKNTKEREKSQGH